MNHYQSSLVYSFFIFMIIFYVPLSGGAKARGESSAIYWNVPAECGTIKDVISRTEAILGKTTESYSKKVTGKISPLNNGWQVKIEVSDGEQNYVRSVTVNTCNGVLELSALLTALAVDPVGVLHSEDPILQSGMEKLNASPSLRQKDHSGEQEHRSASQLSASKEETDPPLSSKIERDIEQKAVGKNADSAEENAGVATSSTSSETAATIGLGFAADVGMSESIRPGVFLFGTLHRKRMLLNISLRYSPRKTYSVDGSRDVAEWTSRVFSAALGVGQLFWAKRVGLGWSIGVAGIGMRAESVDVSVPYRNHVWVGAAEISGRIEWRFSGRGGLFIYPSLQILWSRPKFFIDGIGIIQQPNRFVASGAIGLFFRFG